VQTIEFHGMIEDGAELIVKCLQVYRRICFAVFIPMVDHLILPGNDILCADVAELPLAEIGNQL
jgi:hypothetical protein